MSPNLRPPARRGLRVAWAIAAALGAAAASFAGPALADQAAVVAKLKGTPASLFDLALARL